MAALRPRLEVEGCLFVHVEPWLDPERIEDLWYFDDEPWYTVVDPVLPSLRYDGCCSLGPRSHGEHRPLFLRRWDGPSLRSSTPVHPSWWTSPIPRLTPRVPSPPRSQTAPSSAWPTRPDTHPDDPAPPPPPPASPRTSCASGSMPSFVGTSTVVRSGSSSVNRQAAAPGGTPGEPSTTPSPPACCNTSHCPGTAGTSPSPDASPATPPAV